MPPSAIEQAMPESACLKPPEEIRHRFANLRGVQWRIDLGILPSPSSSSVDDLRRVTANSRRRYAGLRRRLLVDPHLPKDGSNSPDLAIDNPLSQNPDSTWGRFFRNAEVEKTVDQDLTRLYPEHGSYFQTPGCQGMLRRILLLWCLRHPEYGYRQGMHELLAPLLYVLHVDVNRLSEVRAQYEDHFTDKFDDLSFHEYNLIKKYLDSMDDEITPGSTSKIKSLDDLDPEIQTIVLLSDAYGAEGELGIVLSEKFMEHDAYCMFDSLMNGANGVVAMADFFSPRVLEASNALYHLLSVVDSSLHTHLVELGVEPQYFALRWFRVLFGREFSLQNLLIIWDEIFTASNCKLQDGSENDGFYLFTAPRGAFIAGIAVSVILSLRSSLLATENATTCLKRLLNLPENIDLNKLIEKAKSLQSLSLSLSPALGGAYKNGKSTVVRGHTLSFDSSVSPRTPLTVGPNNSYWEEKWRVLHNKAEERKDSNSEKQNQIPRKGWSEKVKWTLSRTESDPSPTKVGSAKKGYKPSARRRLLDDLSRELGLEDDSEKPKNDEICAEDRDSVNNDTEKSSVASNSSNYESDDHSEEIIEENDEGNNGSKKDVNTLQSPLKEREILSGDNNQENNTEKGSIASNLAVYETDDHSEEIIVENDKGNNGSQKDVNTLQSPSKEREVLSGDNNQENGTEKSDIASNLAVCETDDHSEEILEENDNGNASQEDITLPISHLPLDNLQSASNNNEPTGKCSSMQERKLLPGKFQWFWKFGRTSIGEENAKSSEIGSNSSMFSAADRNSKNTPKGENADQNVMGTLRNLGNSMLEHIQAIELVFQQDRGQGGSLDNFSKNVIVGKGQVTAMTALSELRKISNLLSEM